MAFVRLPQGMAYALLAGLPPQYGLYTELFGCLFYSLFATSRQNSVGTNPILALLIGNALQERINGRFKFRLIKTIECRFTLNNPIQGKNGKDRARFIVNEFHND